MTESEENKYFRAIIDITSKHEIDEELFWVKDNNNYIALIICNDVFMWGCSDATRIEPHEVGDLRKACNDCENEERFTGHVGALLFCARKNKMRPQGAFYKFIESSLHKLFNKCGPKRKTGFGNPYDNDVDFCCERSCFRKKKKGELFCKEHIKPELTKSGDNPKTISSNIKRELFWFSLLLLTFGLYLSEIL